MKDISQALGITPEEYETERFNAYWKWCEKLSCTVSDTQKILAYNPISRLYNTEIAKCEEEFLKRIKNYRESITVTKRDRKRLYEQCTAQVHENCKPISLIREAIKSQSIDKSLNVKVAYVAVRGVVLDRITLRLN